MPRSSTAIGMRQGDREQGQRRAGREQQRRGECRNMRSPPDRRRAAVAPFPAWLGSSPIDRQRERY